MELYSPPVSRPGNESYGGLKRIHMRSGRVDNEAVCCIARVGLGSIGQHRACRARQSKSSVLGSAHTFILQG